MSPYTPRYPGPRWSIQYGAYDGIEKFALGELHRTVQNFLPYVMEILPADTAPPAEQTILIGTPRSSARIRRLVEQQIICPPEHPEGFEIAALPDPDDPARRLVVIAGRESAGLLYGVETFNARVLGRLKHNRAALDAALRDLNGLNIREAPRIAERGVWTWGYVIYDYRRFIDNMARLRLNMLTIWNDTPPLNCREVLDYAHERGVRVFLGFPWGWGTDYNLAQPADREGIAADALCHYQEKIAPLCPDGIYFQTLTEHNHTELAGHSVADVTCELVNQVAARLYEITPGLDIHFGLHATSIGEHYGDLAGLDPRITIVWEDAGALPYSYTPWVKDRGRGLAETVEYSRQLAAFRPGTRFGLVPKGWTCLNWFKEFEHHSDYLLGQRGAGFTRRRLAARRWRWRLVNALWRALYPNALHFYRALYEIAGEKMIVEGLVEDGLLEERIQSSLALYAEMLWNPLEAGKTIRERAGSRYYQEC